VKRWGLLLGAVLLCGGASAQFSTFYNDPTTVPIEGDGGVNGNQRWSQYLPAYQFTRKCVDSMRWIPETGVSSNGSGPPPKTTYPNELHNDLVCTMQVLLDNAKQTAQTNTLIYGMCIGLSILIVVVTWRSFYGVKG